jgi:hypothetical protein
MIKQIYSIYDMKAECFTSPIVQVNEEISKRIWVETIADENSQFAKHPFDYALFHLGSFDDTSGVVQPLEFGSQQVMTAAEALQSLRVQQKKQQQLELNAEHSARDINHQNEAIKEFEDFRRYLQIRYQSYVDEQVTEEELLEYATRHYKTIGVNEYRKAFKEVSELYDELNSDIK